MDMTTPISHDDPLILYGEVFQSRLMLGTSRYPSPATLEAAVRSGVAAARLAND